MRKSRILTFLFALWPGAGQMYLGYMKRGVSLMLLFCLLMAISSFTGFGVFIFLLPIVWFYGFFDTINLRSMSYEFLPQDDFLFHLDSINAPELVKFFQRRHLLAGVLLTFVYNQLSGRFDLFSINVTVRHYLVLLVLGAVASVLGIFGDLFDSAVKRQAGIKDYGTIFPGHGGILDRFDSVMFIAPFVSIAVRSFFYLIAR